MKDTLRECIEEGGEGRPDRSALGSAHEICILKHGA